MPGRTQGPIPRVRGCGRRLRAGGGEVVTDHHSRIVVLEQLLAGDHVKGRRGKRVLIGPAIERVAHELLGSGVRHGADGHVGGGQT